MRSYPALELIWPSEPAEEEIDLALAALDDYAPVAVDQALSGVRVFFATAESQRAGYVAVQGALPNVTVRELAVEDENWAERSQAQLTPIRVGNLIVTPPWHEPTGDSPIPGSQDSPIPARAYSSVSGSPHPRIAVAPRPKIVVVLPSMGFGTGHHPSTRLCLRLLQKYLGPEQAVLDVGTGSGVLAIAARVLGASHVLGVDTDPDALTNARENIALNHVDGIDVAVADIGDRSPRLTGRFDVTFANLTGALLARSAAALLATLAPGGLIIASGYQPDERGLVQGAFEAAGGTLADEAIELDWVGGVYRVRGGG